MKTLILAGLLGLTLVGCGGYSQKEKDYLTYLEKQEARYSSKNANITSHTSPAQLIKMGHLVCDKIKKDGPEKYVLNNMANKELYDFIRQSIIADSATENLCPKLAIDYDIAYGKLITNQLKP